MKINRMNDFWITVDVSKGMFSDEYAIELKIEHNKVVSFFVNKKLIKEDKGKHLLSVILVKRNKKRSTNLVLLPTETFETSTRWVEVPVI